MDLESLKELQEWANDDERHDYNLLAGFVLDSVIQIINIKNELNDKLKVYHKAEVLPGIDKKIQELIDEALKITGRYQTLYKEHTNVKKVISKYYDYYGKDASIPSVGLTEISWKYVRLYNTHGLLATYNRKTGEFTPKYE